MAEPPARGTANPLHLPAAMTLLLASGFAALAYQIVWTQQGTIWLGHESTAVLAVVAAFFAGLAVGAHALGRRIEASAHPLRWYAACELAIGLWGLVLVVLMAPAAQALLSLTGERPTAWWQAAVAFVGTFVLLLPATAAMGATLPALERALACLHPGARTLGALYAANTLGAVVGVLAAAFWLVPEFGLVSTSLVCVALNLLCAIAALHLSGGALSAAPIAPSGASTARPLTALALTGLLGIGYEVLVVRVLRQVSENTVYTFAILLAIYLIGTAAGAAAYQRWLAPRARDDRLSARLTHALAVACLLGAASLWMADSLKRTLLQLSGPGMGAALAAEAALACVAFLLPALVMGALFSHLCTRAVSQGVGFGRAIAANTMGAAAAPIVFGVLLAPALGPKVALLTVVACYLALAVHETKFSLPAAATAAAVLAAGWLAPPLAFVDVPEGGRILSYRDGAMGAVSVVEDRDGVASLHIDNRQQEGSNATLYADTRQALLPLLLHPAPRQALFLGLGTGVTVHAAVQDAQLQVDAVELMPEVIEASKHFTAAQGDGQPHPRLTVIAADARRYVRATPRRYDLIVSDNFHPARSGSASLYTVEHFRAVHERLAPGGVFCQWLPLHQLDLPTLRSIVAAFVTVAPRGWALLATNSLETPVLGLVARADGGRFDLDLLRARLRSVALPTPAAAFGVADELPLLGSFVAGPRALARFAADAPRNSDDHPIVAYRAPRLAYARDTLPRDRLLDLLQQLDVRPEELLESSDVQWSAKLTDYWRARDQFLLAGRDVRPSNDVRRMLTQVRNPLLEVLRISPDFRPAYDPLLQMAEALARTDPMEAHALLGELSQIQPERPEAIRALRFIEASKP